MVLHAVRTTVVAAATSVAMLLAPVMPGGSAASAAETPPVTPGAFSGYAFDARCAPTQSEMDAWLTDSPYWGVGIYVGGSTMSCRPTAADPGQPHLDATWVQRQAGNGWRLLPIWVGPQASCSRYADRIDPDPTARYAAADRQGRVEAAAAVARVRELGIGAGSTLWYDLEGGFDVADDDCRRSALRFLSGWTEAVRAGGFRSGVYSSVAAGVYALDNADRASPGSYTMPDQVWFAWFNGRADVDGGPWLRPDSWAGQRAHQYAGDVEETHGGVTQWIDRNYLVVGGGSRAPRAPRTCGVGVDFPDYRRLARGSSGPQVRALQCLLKQRGRYAGRVDGRYDAAVQTAVRRWRRASGLPASGRVDPRAWVVLHAQGAAPLLKRGSAVHAVRRLQRALNVATAADLTVTGVLDAPTESWLRHYQRSAGLAPTGVVTPVTWAALQRGRLG